MAEPLSVLGGLSAGGQILGTLIKTTIAISEFCANFQSAPSQLNRINDRLLTLRDILVEIESHTESLSGDFLPERIRDRLCIVITTLNSEIAGLQSHLVWQKGDKCSIKERLQWATFRKRLARERLQELDRTEMSLTNIIQTLTFRYTLISLVESHNRQTRDDAQSKDARIGSQNVAIARIKSITLASNNVLRKLGISGAVSYIEDRQRQWKARLAVGIRPPAWALPSFVLQLNLTSPMNGVCGFDIASGHVHLHQRMPDDSLFMRACHDGDIPMMQQCVDDNPWVLRARTFTTGETPLLLAIRGESLQATKWLLEQGVNPDDGDDDQVLPVFATFKFTPWKNSSVMQLPPTWIAWMDCLRLLISKNASIHETAWGKTMGMMNVHRVLPHPSAGDHALDYIRLLHSENYMDFDTCDAAGWSPLLTAIRSPSDGLEAVTTLAKLGVNLSKIFDDGRTYLHMAAEMSHDVRVLEYLYDKGCAIHLNRQESWGWTPLHCCVFGMTQGKTFETKFKKLKFLLDKGADPEIKSREIHRIVIPDHEHFTPIELAEHLESDRIGGLMAPLLRSYIRYDAEDVFYDAVSA
ncbi:ankyrin repeat-containing domain protein [Xylariaceae sp. FL1272]|nr:ankyrin repeat-containing domain protein [Xylariaceae sp. FL1272]